MSDEFRAAAADFSVCAIVVSFHPEVERLSQLFRQLQTQCQYVLVDNGSEPGVVDSLQRCLTNDGHLVRMDENRGIAAAQNAGVAYARKHLADKPKYFLFLDQDSVPSDNLIGLLKREYEDIERKDPQVAAIGPTLLDVRSSELHSLHQEAMGLYIKSGINPGQPGRRYKVASLNSSGTFVEDSTLETIGAFREDLFIDHVDTEWSHRARHKGYSLYVSSHACLEHEMGRGLEKIWMFGNQYFPSRAPLRHYYLFRNNVFLLSEPHMSRTWKFWSILKLAFSFLYFGIVSRDRREQRSMMLKGISAGRKGELGRLNLVE